MKLPLLSTFIIVVHIACLAGFRGHSTQFNVQRVLKESQSQKACDDHLENAIFPCECIDLNENQTALQCVNEQCTFCNDDSSLCGSPKLTTTFGLEGDAELFSSEFTYTKGRSDSISVAMTDCDKNNNGGLVCTSCVVSVNGQHCNHCELQNCTGGSLVARPGVPAINCTNIEADAVYNMCNPTLTIPSGSVFEILTSGAFQNCIPVSSMPSFAPTLFASMVPMTAASGFPSSMPTVTPSSTSPNTSPVPTDLRSNSPTETPTLSPMPTTAFANVTNVPSFDSTDVPTFKPSATDAPSQNLNSGGVEISHISMICLILVMWAF